MSGDATGDDGRTAERACPVSRRAFLAGVGAAGAVAVTAGSGLAAAAEGNPDTEAGEDYEYLYRNTPLDEPIPTAIQASDVETVESLRGIGEGFRSSSDPPGAYARLAREEAVEVFQTDGVEAMRFAPGANPFWRLDDYPGRVFPPSDEVLDYIAFEEALAGLSALESEHSDRLNVRTVGQSPGHRDVVEDRPEQYDVKLVELTNDVNDDTWMARKQKVVNSIGIHGDERAGVEAGLRFIENVLRGEEPEVEDRLDDVALLFVLTNPDGWASRAQLTDVQGGSSTFKRANASGVDPNRQYPTVGWIDPNHNPADPDGRDLEDDQPGIDDDVESRYTDRVPDSLGIVDALREYDNYVLAADFHGMFGSEELVLGLNMNDQYGVEERARLEALNRAVDDRFDDDVTPVLRENRSAIDDAARTRAPRGGAPQVPYGYATILDTIGYTTTGGFGSWLSDALEKGGIDATGISFEMALDNRTRGRMDFYPGLNETHVVAYQECMRALAVQATRDVDGSIRTNGRSTAYVGTDSLTRSSADLAVDPDTTVATDETSVSVGPGRRGVSLDLPADVASLHVGVVPEAGVDARTRLSAPAGDLRAEDVADGGGFQAGTTLSVDGAEAGAWRLELEADHPTEATVRVTAVDADGPPDPEPTLGYEQRPYEVSPLGYLDDYGAAIDGGDTTRESVRAVANGALVEGGRPAVDNLVVIHDDGAGNRRYLQALEEFVEAGGRLVLTDTGVALLANLSVGGAGSIGSRDVRRVTRDAAALGSKRDGDLLENVRSIEREIWKATPLGYRTSGEAPMTLVDSRAFESAGGDVAATTGGDVSLGSLDGVRVIGSLLPPASQSNLHPFGLYEYAVSSMGQQLLVNALGHDQPGANGGGRR
jgi:hypothetical protein